MQANDAEFGCNHEWQQQQVAPIAAYLHLPPERVASARLCPKCGMLEVTTLGAIIRRIVTTVRIA